MNEKKFNLSADTTDPWFPAENTVSEFQGETEWVHASCAGLPHPHLVIPRHLDHD